MPHAAVPSGPRWILALRIAVILAATGVATAGYTLLSFARTAEGTRTQALAAGAGLSPARKAEFIEKAHSWQGSRFLPASARELEVALLLSGASPDTNAAEAAVRSLLTIKPASSAWWQSLAELHLSNGGSLDDTSRMSAISRMVGPREGPVMVRRYLTVLARWPELDAAQRALVAKEMAFSIASNVDYPTVLRVRAAIQGLDRTSRSDVIAALSSLQPEGPLALRRLDLGAS